MNNISTLLWMFQASSFGVRGGLYADAMLGEESGEGLAGDPARAAAWQAGNDVNQAKETRKRMKKRSKTSRKQVENHAKRMQTLLLDPFGGFNSWSWSPGSPGHATSSWSTCSRRTSPLPRPSGWPHPSLLGPAVHHLHPNTKQFVTETILKGTAMNPKIGATNHL